MAYISDESGRNEVYVRPFSLDPPGSAGKWQVSTDGGLDPIWARNSRELFYRNGDRMMAVDVTTTPSFTPDKPRQLFRGGFVSILNVTSCDVSADGRRFVMILPGQPEAPPTQLNLLLNWAQELKRR